MALYSCRHPDTGVTVSVDEADPGAWAGQTLVCRTGTSPKGDPIWSDVTFPAAEPDPPEEPDPADTDPWGQRVADFLGHGDNPELVTLAGQHAAIMTALVRAYTRTNGFFLDEPNEDLAAVITTATARLVANPEQNRHSVGDVQMLDGFRGFNLAELFVLNRYRKRAL